MGALRSYNSIRYPFRAQMEPKCNRLNEAFKISIRCFKLTGLKSAAARRESVEFNLD